LNDTKEMLTTAWVARKRMDSELEWETDEYESVRLEAEQTILETMQKSKKTIEEIYGSGKKAIWTL
jgi:hypothetical protein